jgi:hypothetical protein
VVGFGFLGRSFGCLCSGCELVFGLQDEESIRDDGQARGYWIFGFPGSGKKLQSLSLSLSALLTRRKANE